MLFNRPLFVYYLLSPFSFSPKFHQVSPGKSHLSFGKKEIWASGTSGKTGTSVGTKPSSRRGSNSIQPGAVYATKTSKVHCLGRGNKTWSGSQVGGRERKKNLRPLPKAETEFQTFSPRRVNVAPPLRRRAGGGGGRSRLPTRQSLLAARLGLKSLRPTSRF